MTEKHIHKYVRIKLGKNKRIEFKCALPTCVHHIKPELAVGRLSQCNRCGVPFILTKVALTRAKPHCDACTIGRDTKLDTIEELLNAGEI